MLHILEHALEHTLEDTVKLLPFLFLTYLFMEFLEHKTSDKVQNIVKKGGRLGPFFGGILGALPQCGFSAAASSFYAGRVITLGTLIAIYLSTSDEMLPVLLAEADTIGIVTIIKILAVKAVIGMAAGFLVDFIFTSGRENAVEHHHAHDGHHHASEHAHDGHHHASEHAHDGHHHASEHAHDGHHHASEHDHDSEHDHSHASSHDHHHENSHIHELCEHDHCHCDEDGNVFKAALIHTLKTTGFILLVTLILNIILEILGEDVLRNLLLNKPVIGQLLAGLVGLIPNCAASVVLTQLYLEGAMSFAACMSGLLVGAGVGILVLFRANRDRKENIKIVFLLYSIGVIAGLLMELMHFSI